jgi:hypothetical protein
MEFLTCPPHVFMACWSATPRLTRLPAHYILDVKKNQPSLYSQLKGLRWRKVPILHAQDDHGYGRDERRTVKVVAVSQGLLFPHATQAIAITRRTRPAGTKKWKTVTIYAVTSLDAHQATPAELAGWIRGHFDGTKARFDFRPGKICLRRLRDSTDEHTGWRRLAAGRLVHQHHASAHGQIG